MNNKLFFSSKLQTGKTPDDLYNILDNEFHFDFDPCPENSKFDGLTISWKKSNYCNPPYTNQKAWVEKAYNESLKNKTCVMLLPARTDTKLFHDFIFKKAHEIRFIKGRLRFKQYTNSAPFPSMIVIFKND
tara:strand:+ start:205 stop:597 length:393 start_codon:yes stop_codon:yes gene_type:complete